ncbi:MAG TPA: chorismate mutase [Bacteroidia bacterium]|jgi:chorismate mutase|nr:chorismate mutase [Bacteroidia bacterium]
MNSSINFSDKSCYVIAGPCSAESREQVLQTAAQIADGKKAQAFRAGVWKPRTRPGGFEGMGVQALPWLQEVQTTYHLPVAIEVAQPEHIEAALKHNINFFWIGARTTANPFSVQELAEALQGVDCRVMVKNPIHPDLQLWIGAIERVLSSGVKQVAAIHRGFHTSAKNTFRNTPLWQIPIELKVNFPNMPIICDPSHISGRKDLVFDIAQNALDLGMNGLMIETHINPNEALSDKAQQITPFELNELLNHLQIKEKSSANPAFNAQLNSVRDNIDTIDAQIIALVKERLHLVEKIANEKQKNNITAFQLERWMEILKTRTDWGTQQNLTKDFIEKLFQLIHEESIRTQIELMKKEGIKP